MASLGAACCGGGPGVPALILGDERAQLAATYGYSEITDEVGVDTYWHRRGFQETSETIRFEGAHIFRDRWQGGFTLPFLRRARGGASASGLGDVAGSVAYEYLPEWEYSAWRPRGTGYLQLTLPTGKSVNEADARYQLDARGRGFTAVGAGTALTKVFGAMDALINFEAHRSFSKQFSTEKMRGALHPGWGGNLLLGSGYSVSRWRLGGGLSWTYEDAVDVSGDLESHGSPQRYATATVSAAFALPDEYSANFVYSDQTLFGEPTNTTLGKGLIVSVQKRWLR